MQSVTLWVRIPLRWGVRDTTLCDKVCQWLTAGRWFSPGTSVSSTNKTNRHDITEILFKVALVPDLPLCLSTGPVAKKNVYDGFLLIRCNFKLEDVLFRSDSTHNDRVDSLWECATRQAVMTVAQWHRNQIIRGPLVLGKNNVYDGFMLKWCNFKFYGILFNLDTYRRM